MGCCGRSRSHKPVAAPRNNTPGVPPVTTGKVTVRVYSEAEKQAAISARPGYYVTVARFGPTTTVLTFTPRS